jgi:glycosyltransferase involved in cell wall biosynthesis
MSTATQVQYRELQVEREPRHPKLLIVGPMVGANGKAVTTQSLILSKLFRSAGYPVESTSTVANRYLRFGDIAQTVVRRARSSDFVILDVFGGPSFVVEDTVSAITTVLRTPTIMFLRGGAMPEFMSSHPAWSRRVLRRADLLITPSQFLARTLQSHGFSPRVIPNVVDISKYPYQARRAAAPKLLWMRTFHEIYNPLMAVRVLAEVRKTYPEVTLVMGGEEKGLLGATRQLACELGVADAVSFPGFLDLRKKLEHGAAADIFLNTNIVDNTPVSVLEAAALGLPVVATEVGGIGDLLQHERTGILVRSDDHQAMAAAVCRLVESPELAAGLSAAGRGLAESCGWDRVRLEWEKVFVDIRRARRQKAKVN